MSTFRMIPGHLMLEINEYVFSTGHFSLVNLGIAMYGTPIAALEKKLNLTLQHCRNT